MKCTIEGCPGEYEATPIIHTVKRGEDILVFEDVPAEVCTVCSDTLLSPETVRHLQELMRNTPKPEKFAPLYEYV
jgi:YgiT-type zinc finger domain-containing protein